MAMFYFWKENLMRLKEGEKVISRNQIIDLRTGMDKSVADFAKMIGCSRYSVYLYESGKRRPCGDRLSKINELLAERNG